MKKKLLFFAFGLVLLSSCADKKTIDGVEYKPYGLFNQETKNDSIKYQVSPETVIVSVIFSETLIVPVYTIGWELWEPVGKK